MQNEDQIYRTLQRHLDNQAVGFPAVKSGAEIRLLKRFFTPEETRLALNLNYRPRSADRIYRDLKGTDLSFREMEQMLDGMLAKGVIGHLERDGARYYHTVPLVVGMYEGQLNRLTPEFLKDFEEYTSDRAFGLEFLSTKVPQLRTIPIGRSITPEHHVATYDQLRNLLEETAGPFVVNACICRQSAEMKGRPCQKTTRTETCLALGDIAKNCLRMGVGRSISKEEALTIAMENEADGLVLQPSNAQRAEFICACCGCCCGMLRMHKALPRPVDFWNSNFYASVDAEACSGCGTCVERCQVNALRLSNAGAGGVVKINPDRCIGCGNCVSSCPTEALRLVKKEREVTPPETHEALYDILGTHRKGKLGKFRLAIRLVLQGLKSPR